MVELARHISILNCSQGGHLALHAIMVLKGMIPL